MLTTYGTAQAPIAVVEGFDGTTAWKKANADAIRLKPDEAALIELEAKLALASDLRPILSDLRYRKTVKLEGRNVHLVTVRWLAGGRCLSTLMRKTACCVDVQPLYQQ